MYCEVSQLNFFISLVKLFNRLYPLFYLKYENHLPKSKKKQLRLIEISNKFLFNITLSKIKLVESTLINRCVLPTSFIVRSL